MSVITQYAMHPVVIAILWALMLKRTYLLRGTTYTGKLAPRWIDIFFKAVYVYLLMEVPRRTLPWMMAAPVCASLGIWGATSLCNGAEKDGSEFDAAAQRWSIWTWLEKHWFGSITMLCSQVRVRLRRMNHGHLSVVVFQLVHVKHPCFCIQPLR